ncbi:RnfH family protein [Guyparkeria sp. GHLCS8-2]|uniref:RnfH family protein n=1 Tax=Guyparkeria halopsychrophila TaxID=3139421 RepID=UPI0037C8CD4E
MKVEVAYARPDIQMLLEVDVAEGATVEEAIRRSGILERFPEIDLSQQKVGVFAKVVPLSQALREWDRVEIYRPLIADPKAARRQRAQNDGARKVEAKKDEARPGRKLAPSDADDREDETAPDTKKPAE